MKNETLGEPSISTSKRRVFGRPCKRRVSSRPTVNVLGMSTDNRGPSGAARDYEMLAEWIVDFVGGRMPTTVEDPAERPRARRSAAELSAAAEQLGDLIDEADKEDEA